MERKLPFVHIQWVPRLMHLSGPDDFSALVRSISIRHNNMYGDTIASIGHEHLWRDEDTRVELIHVTRHKRFPPISNSTYFWGKLIEYHGMVAAKFCLFGLKFEGFACRGGGCSLWLCGGRPWWFHFRCWGSEGVDTSELRAYVPVPQYIPPIIFIKQLSYWGRWCFIFLEYTKDLRILVLRREVQTNIRQASIKRHRRST